jgi:quercetin dioxygenase-like cupin family protein
MRSCRAASLFATGTLLLVASVGSAIGACREAASPQVPPVTSALVPPAPGLAPTAPPGDPAATDASAATATLPPISASFVDAPGKIDAPICSRLLIEVAKGRVVAMGETLVTGDALVVTHPDPIKLEGNGLVVVARRDLDPDVCGVKAHPRFDKKVVRATTAADLHWAGGTMSAHLDIGPKLSPDVYLGRLEGTAAVAEHTHPAWEILAAVEASGTFVLNGTEGHLGPRQIIMVPPGSKHAWKPDPGSKLVAIQMYSPPGPEQRFIALAAADKDAGARDAH